MPANPIVAAAATYGRWGYHSGAQQPPYGFKAGDDGVRTAAHDPGEDPFGVGGPTPRRHEPPRKSRARCSAEMRRVERRLQRFDIAAAGHGGAADPVDAGAPRVQNLLAQLREGVPVDLVVAIAAGGPVPCQNLSHTR